MTSNLFAHILNNALDAALQFRQNGFGRTVVVHQIPAEHGARERRLGLGRFNDRNNLVLLQGFGCIIVITVLGMDPVSLELNKTRTCHNSATDAALTLMAHPIAIYVIFDAAFVVMRASELPESFIGWR
jgi:hypothetical protein